MCMYVRSHRTQARYKCAYCHTTNNTNLLFFWNNYLFWKEIDDFYFQLYVYGFVRACARTHTHAYILVCQILLSVPGNMCSRRMERSHLHPPCIFSPGSKLLGNEFPKGKKKIKSPRATGPHGYPPSASAPVYRIHSAEVFQPELN